MRMVNNAPDYLLDSRSLVLMVLLGTDGVAEFVVEVMMFFEAHATEQAPCEAGTARCASRGPLSVSFPEQFTLLRTSIALTLAAFYMTPAPRRFDGVA
jgi:hypothetical protein